MATIGPVLGGLGFLALVVGLALFLPIPFLKRHRPLAKWLAIGGGAFFIVGVVTAPDPEPPTTAATDQGEAAGAALIPSPTAEPTGQPPAKTADVLAVRDTGYFPPILNLDLDAGGRREGTVFDDAGRTVLRLSDDAAAGRGLFARPIEAVNFTLLGGAKGGSSNRRIAHFTIPAATLRRLSKAGASPRGALDAATEAGSWEPENDDVVDQFCLAQSPICEKLQ